MALGLEGIPEQGSGREMRRVDAQRRPEATDRLIDLAELLEGCAQVRLRLDKGGPQAESFLEVRPGRAGWPPASSAMPRSCRSSALSGSRRSLS